MVQNFMGTIFRTKITTKNFFMTQSQKFVILSRKKKKSIKIFWKMAKNAKIFKIQMWVSGRNRPIFGRKVADRVRSSQNSGQNFFHHQISKIRDFIQESRPPPPPVFREKRGGGFRELYGTYPRYHLSCPCCLKISLFSGGGGAIIRINVKIFHHMFYCWKFQQ